MIFDILFTGSITDWIIAIIITLLIILILVIVFFVLTSQKHGSKHITEISELQTTQRIEDGYIGVDMSPANVVGMSGIALTDLRPSGKITVMSVDYDAVATLDFIAAGADVVVEKYENAQLYVKEKKL